MGDRQCSRILLVCSLIAAACTATICSSDQDSDVLRPPIGNSLAMKAKTYAGKVMYKCSAGEWLLVGATAGLVQATDPSSRVGLYTSAVAKDQTRASATWILNNSPDDIAESGHSNSSVTGKEIQTVPSGGSISEALLQATFHQFSGAAAIISYVQRVSPQGGDPPATQTCGRESLTVQVPFDAEFWLWKQDLVPPSAPQAISASISHERAVEGLFGEGEVEYLFDGSSWQQVGAQAALYNMPGGMHMGKYSLRAAATGGKGGKAAAASYSWKSSSPNGFEVVGRDESEPVLVDRNCLAWSLVAVTSSSSNDRSSMLGAYSHVQMVSTKGGLPPSQTTSAPLEGEVLTAPFSAIFWFYTKS